MSFEWEIVESGPKSADHTVLLIPGGLNTSRSYAELMAQPALAGVRLIAVTLPGHGGTPPPEDFSIENYARLTADLVADFGCDVVLGFSLGEGRVADDAELRCVRGADTAPPQLKGRRG